MVVTDVSGEPNQVGANLVADAMEANGWTAGFLGTNLPHSSALAAVEESSASVLCISTTIVANLLSVTELVRLVRDKLNERKPRIIYSDARLVSFGGPINETRYVPDSKAVGN
jgi:methanogenic corrinoid protein MtbC1